VHKTIIQKLANKHDLPLHKIEEAVMHQFKYAAKVIKAGNFEPVRLPFLGKFHVKTGRLKYLQQNERAINSK
tara:strand:+ start:1064 stop:1279 length:216 start_codon:yes stop_codon:yes gene_type:complete